MEQVSNCTPEGTPRHELETQATQQIKLAASTIYEAEIAQARSLSSLQKQRVMGTAARNFAKHSGNAAPSEWIHPTLLQITVQTACASASTKKKHLLEKKHEA